MDYISKTTSDGRFVRVKNYKKRIRRNRIKRRICFFVFLLFCLMLFLYLAPFFNIKEIRCAGEDIVSKEEILTASTISFDYNLFRTSVKKAKQKIEIIPYIKKAIVKRKFPNVISIAVTECTVFGNVPLGEGYIYIDEEGKALEFCDSAKENLPYIENTGIISFEAGKKLQCDNPEKKDILVPLLSVLSENNLLDKVSVIDLADAGKVSIKYANSLEIYIGNIDNLNYKIDFAIKTILEKLGNNPVGYLDVSNPKYGFVYREKK